MTDTAASVTIDHPARSSRFTNRLATLTQTRRSQIELVVAIILYLGFACYMTWPLVTGLAHSIYGAPGDPFGTMAFFRELVDHHHNPFLPGTITQISAPEGQPIPWPRDLASAPEVLTLYLLTALFGAIRAYGLYTLAGYTLTGTATFLFARRLTANTWAALIAGWAFAFYPFAALNGQGHLDHIHGWVIVLAIWRMVELMWRPSRRNGLLAGLAVSFCMWWSPYFILFSGVAYVAATAGALFFGWRDRKLRVMLGPQLIAALIVVLFLAFLGVLSTAGASEGIGTPTRNPQFINIYSARPLEYLLPDIQSPLFGGVTHHYLETHLHGSGSIEATLYVGVTVILLALIAIASAIRGRLTRPISRAVIILSLVAAVAAITSMQPHVHIFGASIPFPSYFISQLTTAWRVYSRFVIVVMLALAVLAAIGLDVLTRKRSPWVRIAIMSFATVAVPLDLWAPQGGHVTKIKTPGVYKTLAHLPTGTVAEYPLGSAGASDYRSIFYQNAYNKPIISGYSKDSYQELRAFSLSNLAEPSTPVRLATLGVRYVVVNSTPANWGWTPPGKPGPGLRLIAHEPYGDLYLVTAHPASSALVTPGSSFDTQPTVTGVATWLARTSGTIELAGACTSCDGVLSMTLMSFKQPRQVAILDSKGHVLGHGPVEGGTNTRVRIPFHFTKHATLTMTATPGPQPVSETEPGTRVSIRVTNLEFEGPTRGGGNSSAPASGKHG